MISFFSDLISSAFREEKILTIVVGKKSSPEQEYMTLLMQDKVLMSAISAYASFLKKFRISLSGDAGIKVQTFETFYALYKQRVDQIGIPVVSKEYVLAKSALIKLFNVPPRFYHNDLSRITIKTLDTMIEQMIEMPDSHIIQELMTFWGCVPLDICARIEKIRASQKKEKIL